MYKQLDKYLFQYPFVWLHVYSKQVKMLWNKTCWLFLFQVPVFIIQVYVHISLCAFYHRLLKYPRSIYWDLSQNFRWCEYLFPDGSGLISGSCQSAVQGFTFKSITLSCSCDFLGASVSWIKGGVHLKHILQISSKSSDADWGKIPGSKPNI